MVLEIKNQIKSIVKEDIDIDVSASEKEEFGHYSTNVAFKLASVFNKKPLEIASDLVIRLKEKGERIFSKVEVAAPGFVNFWLKPEIFQNELVKVLKQKNKYGKSSVKGQMSKVDLEFVSANPTGPLTMANGRSGFYGDVLANVLENAGQKVTREYYINDTGNQVKILGESILAVLGKVGPREEHYKGKYVKSLAQIVKHKLKEIRFRNLTRSDLQILDKVGKWAAAILLKEIKQSLKAVGIKYDVWFSEDKNLHKKGELKKALEFLKKKGLAEEKDGALWLGDGVLIKSDGNPTYFLADLAYHFDKFLKRKFDLAVVIWGADHHGYAQRMKNGVEVFGIKSERLKILITQLVRLVSGGKEVRMSKRKGEFVTLDELLEEVGSDAARFFFLMHSLDTHMDFDLDLAKEKSQKNPVYYAQYAYVRASNILRKAQIAKHKLKEIRFHNLTRSDLQILKSDSEIKLMLELVKLPDVLAQTAEDYQVHRLTKYALELARAFHNFYEIERVLNAENEDLKKARLALVLVTKTVLNNLFDVLGISKPAKM